MLDPGVIAAASESGSGIPAWALVATAAVTAVGTAAGAFTAPLVDRTKRRDDLKKYKRNIYRNFLDHAYWYGRLDGEKKQKRAEWYVADWHRIRLITSDATILGLIKDVRDPANFTDALAINLLDAFAAELGTEMIDEARLAEMLGD